MHNAMQDQRGFTLIELMITLVVLSFGLLGLAGLQVQLVRANSFNSSMTIATAIGTDLLEEANALSLIDIKKGSLVITAGTSIDNSLLYDVDINNDGTPDDPYNGRFTWTRQLTWDTNLPERFCRVDVAVFWVDTSEHRLDFRTVVE